MADERVVVVRKSENKENKETKPAEVSIYLQYEGNEVSIDIVEKAVRQNYDEIKKGEDPPESIVIYLKPEDRKAYYVINSDFAGEVCLLAD